MNVQTLSNELKSTAELWDNHVIANKNISDDLGPFGFPGISKVEFGAYIYGLSRLLEKVAPLLDSGIDPFLKRTIFGLQNVINNLASNRAALKDNPGGVIAAVIQGIELLRAPLIANGVIRNTSDTSKKNYIESSVDLSLMSASIISARRHLNEASNIKSELENIKVSIERTKTEIEPLKQLVDTNVKETNTKSQQIEDNRAKVEAFVSEYSNTKKQFNELVDTIASYKANIGDLESEHGSHIQKIKSTLEAAERVGLAKSFSVRKDELQRQGYMWLGLLILSLIGLFLVGYCIIHPAVSDTKGVERLLALAAEIPLTAPFIWVAWYSATHLGYNLRVAEDYSFKVASALALDGYKREVSSVDKELEKRLLDGAIGNFSENPIRIFQKKDVSGSPWQDILRHPEIKEKFKSLSDAVVNVSKRQGL